MTRDEFEVAVREFTRIYCEDYFASAREEVFDHDGELTAVILAKTSDGETWKIPLCPLPGGDKMLVIPAGEDTHLDAGEGGLYAHLWFEARERIQRLGRLLGLAARIVRDFAEKNPRWTDEEGKLQDPWGAHELLKELEEEAKHVPR